MPLPQHLEEVRYLHGEISRLQEKVDHATRSERSALQLRERLYGRLDGLAAEAAAQAGAAGAAAAEAQAAYSEKEEFVLGAWLRGQGRAGGSEAVEGGGRGERERWAGRCLLDRACPIRLPMPCRPRTADCGDARGGARAA